MKELLTRKELKGLEEKLKKEYGREIMLLFYRNHSFEECCEAIEACMAELMEEGEEYAYCFADAIELYDNTPSGELWVKFWRPR